jgi:hypothetical protein
VAPLGSLAGWRYGSGGSARTVVGVAGHSPSRPVDEGSIRLVLTMKVREDCRTVNVAVAEPLSTHPDLAGRPAPVTPERPAPCRCSGGRR